MYLLRFEPEVFITRLRKHLRNMTYHAGSRKSFIQWLDFIYVSALSGISIREPTAVIYCTTCGLLQNTAVTYRMLPNWSHSPHQSVPSSTAKDFLVCVIFSR